MKPVDTIIFDLGGVLIDWNPVYLYRKIFAKEEEIDHFLSRIATPDWNEQQDAGRPLQEATEWLVERHPEYEEPIRAYYGRWPEMLGGPIEGTVSLLDRLRRQNAHSLYALTNWSAETFPVAQARYPFLDWFEGILVSGHEKLKKPDPRIYERIAERFDLDLARCLFIDDSLRNVKGARETGLQAVHFQGPEALEARLSELGILQDHH